MLNHDRQVQGRPAFERHGVQFVVYEAPHRKLPRRSFSGVWWALLGIVFASTFLAIVSAGRVEGGGGSSLSRTIIRVWPQEPLGRP
jgi:hypothetical protein